MRHDTHRACQPEPERIHLGADDEVAYWTQVLGVPEAALRAAVEAVGPMSEDVRSHLAQQA